MTAPLWSGLGRWSYLMEGRGKTLKMTTRSGPALAEAILAERGDFDRPENWTRI